jgi:hypothetical protein
MGIPDQPASLPTPGAGGLPPVTFGGGGHQTFKGDLADNLYPATCVKIEACVGNFEGKQTPQYVLLFAIEGKESQGELAWYVSRKLSTHPKAKLGPTLDALRLARPTPENPDLPNPVGAKAKLLVKNLPRNDGQQGTRLKVMELLAA